MWNELLIKDGAGVLSALRLPLTTNAKDCIMADENTTIPTGARQIPLTQGQYAIVDEADYDWLMQWKWQILVKTDKGGRFYAQRHQRIKLTKERKILLMHRVIMDAPKGMYIDHINGNGLDNRRCNLRICTPSQNAGNRRPTRILLSGYRGVWRNKKGNRYIAIIIIHGKRTYLGCFATAEKAAEAYNKAAIMHFGEFATLNVISTMEK